MSLSSLKTTFLASSIAVAAACGGSEPAATQPTNPTPDTSGTSAPSSAPTADMPPAPTTSATVATPAPSASTPTTPTGPAMPAPWKDMTHAQKLDWMKNVVTPRMAKVFQDFDAARYKQFDCTTCHGHGAKKGKFDMPNPGLPKLTAANHGKKPEVAKFMMEKVVPEMADALQVPKFDMATKTGFGCFNCHTGDKPK